MSDTVRFESLRRRPPVGTQVDLGGLSPIQFEADKAGREFAEVPADLAHFLDRIPEGYRRVDEDGNPVAAPKKGKPAPKQADPVQDPAPAKDTAPSDPDLVVVTDEDDDSAGGDEDKQDGNGGAQDNDDAPSGGDEPVELENMDEDELRALFEKKVGRKPSPRAHRETLIDQIKQASAQ